MDSSLFETVFPSAQPGDDVEAIRRDWEALGPAYAAAARKPPLPVWARRGLPDSGEKAWATLCRSVGLIDSRKAFCIYVHIPFCASRCEFCDCYSFRLESRRDQHVEEYGARLRSEMRAWNRLGSLALRPVSTVHFGGGTPALLGTRAFRRLVDDCRMHFAAGAETEWALETTSSEFTGEMADTLGELGFRRIHFGVQSLDRSVREAANRREPPDIVLRKINSAAETGMVASVDLILGLPGQNLANLIRDIEQLAAAGVEGFSLYALNASRRNRAFIERYRLSGDPGLGKYFLFQAASRHLDRLGYRKTLFNHFARAKDTNLYFTFPQRGEDCLAIGTIADGYFGDYHYRHPEYAAYSRTARDEFPGLQGGIRRDRVENAAHPVATAILSASFPPQLLTGGAAMPAAAGSEMLARWVESAMVRQTSGGLLQLTGNGSWFAGNLIDEVIQEIGRAAE